MRLLAENFSKNYLSQVYNVHGINWVYGVKELLGVNEVRKVNGVIMEYMELKDYMK